MPTFDHRVVVRIVTATVIAAPFVYASAFAGGSAPLNGSSQVGCALPDNMPLSPEGIDETEAPATEQEITTLVALLDARRFETRNAASRRLLADGSNVVPYLVDALGDESGELRFRVSVLLTHHSRFEDVAPHLVDAVEKPHGAKARAILRRRAAQQVVDACRPQHAKKLFKFWDTSVEAFRDRALVDLDNAKTRADAAQVVEPLLGLCDETSRFSEVISRLESLSLTYDHEYHPGFIIAQIFARSSQQRSSAWSKFAEYYLEAFEKLVRELQLQDMSAHAIRKEVAERANSSQGAADFLVSILDESSRRRAVLSTRIGIPPARLQESFCHGLASPDSLQYYQGVGRVHIVQMLSDAIAAWPDAPSDGIVQELISGVAKTVDDGNKPKALAYLDALGACARLPKHKLDVRSGLGRRLGQRLCMGAEKAANNRAYYPTRIVHERIIELLDLGILPEHAVFPQEVLASYLSGEDRATSESQRLAFQRYVRIVNGLLAADIDLSKDRGATRFVLMMRHDLTTNQKHLAEGARELDRLLQPRQSQAGKIDWELLDRELDAWCRSRPGSASSAADSEQPRMLQRGVSLTNLQF